MLRAARSGDPAACETQPNHIPASKEIWAQEASGGWAQGTGKDMGSGPRQSQAWLVDHSWQAVIP